MPYLVTTKRPDERPSRVGHADDMRVTSSREVATLDEAKHYGSVHGFAGEPRTGMRPAEWNDPLTELWELPESGGTVGPLPDGTVIEVERVRDGRDLATYDEVLRVAVDLCGDFDNTEYVRGQAELIADTWGKPGVELGDRVQEVEADMIRIYREGNNP